MIAHPKGLHTGQLLELSDQVSRIATTLARLSNAELPAKSDVQPMLAREILAPTVTAVIRARRMRAQYFDEQLFADPVWDMLLDLFEAELAQRRVSVSSLCIAAEVPATTALRTMAEKNLVIRRNDPIDGRRVYVELSPESSRALHGYFARIGVAPAA